MEAKCSSVCPAGRLVVAGMCLLCCMTAVQSSMWAPVLLTWAWPCSGWTAHRQQRSSRSCCSGCPTASLSLTVNVRCSCDSLQFHIEGGCEFKGVYADCVLSFPPGGSPSVSPVKNHQRRAAGTVQSSDRLLPGEMSWDCFSKVKFKWIWTNELLVVIEKISPFSSVFVFYCVVSLNYTMLRLCQTRL